MAELTFTNTRDNKDEPLISNMKNEAHVEFNREVHERKQLTYGSRHRKCGSKSKKCTLPSDYMTKKEKEKMNGSVHVYRMGEMIPFDEFTTYPADIQQEYITSIQQKYNATKNMIANMFAIPATVFDGYVENLAFEDIPMGIAKTAIRTFRIACMENHGDIYTERAKQLDAEFIPMCWYTYQELSPTDRGLYVNKIIDTFEISLPPIARMFGVSSDAIRVDLRRCGIQQARAHKRVNDVGMAAFNDWLKDNTTLLGVGLKGATLADESPTAPVETEKPVSTSETQSNANSGVNVSGTLVFTGSAEDATAKVREFIDKYMISGQDVTVTLSF